MFDLTKQIYYCYQASCVFAGTALGSTAVDAVRLSDKDFVVQRITMTFRANATGRHNMAASDDGTDEIGGTPDVPCTVQLQENGTDRVHSQVEVDGAMYSYSRSGQLPIPILWTRGCTVTVAATLRKVTAAVGTLRAIFEGYHRYL